MSDAPSFENKLTELESILQQLESGNLPLKDLVSIHKRGKNLLELLDTELKQAEQTLETVHVNSEE